MASTRIVPGSLKIMTLAACVAVFGACAASNRMGAGRTVKTYTADVATVVEAAQAVFVENGLNLEEGAWMNDSTYVITGHRKSALIRTDGEATQVASIHVFIERISPVQTRVRVETSARETSVMASSADRRDDEARRFFTRLDARLE